MSEKSLRIGRGFLAVLLFVAALFLAFLALSARAMRAVTLGTFGDVRTQTVDAPPASHDFVPRQRTVHWLSYTYEVNGKRYWNEVSDIRYYGQTVTVYYDPDHPQTSRLGKPASPILLGALAFLSLAGGALALSRARAPRPTIAGG